MKWNEMKWNEMKWNELVKLVKLGLKMIRLGYTSKT